MLSRNSALHPISNQVTQLLTNYPQPPVSQRTSTPADQPARTLPRPSAGWLQAPLRFASEVPEQPRPPAPGATYLLQSFTNLVIVSPGMSTPATSRAGHIFLSYSGADVQPAHEFAITLRRNRLEVWFDKDSLQPGELWMAAIEQNIERASAMLVYVGKLGVQSWVDREVRFGIVRNTQAPKAFRLIPVLGAGADPKSLPPFLQQHQYIDLRDPHRAPEQIRRLVEILRSSQDAAQPAQCAIPPDYWTTHSPFRSLQVFEPEDSWLFFGRDADTEELLTRLARAPVLVVVGNSGSGKSSLLRAGLIPALQHGRFRYENKLIEHWRIAIVQPSQSPFDYLAETLPEQIKPEMNASERADFIQRCRQKLPQGGNKLRDAIAAIAPKGSHILLVADQFEELFTLTSNQETRVKYIETLLPASSVAGAVTVHLVIALRADFYANCLEYRELSRCLEANQYNVPRMGGNQLRETIEKRLALAGARAEAGLIDSLLTDVGSEPGDLALLEHALGQLWAKRAPTSTLTNHAYTEMGRLRGALGHHADEVCEEIGAEKEHRWLQKIFLELVQLGEGAQDTRRRVPKKSLLRLGDPIAIEKLLTYLASKRLINSGAEAGQDYAEVSHEALIREWPTLRRWLADNREDLLFGRRLTESAEEWQKLNRDRGALLQGARLVQAEVWLQDRPETLEFVRQFIQTSSSVQLILE